MAVDYFLTIEGIEGESQDAQHQGAIELDSWSFGGSNAGASQVDGAGRMGKFDAQPFQFTTKVSKASPVLFRACTTSQHFKGAILLVRKSGERPVEYLKISLANVLIAFYQQVGVSGTSVPNEQVSLSYTKVSIEYRAQRPDGTLGEPVSGGFDLKENRPV